MKVYQQPTPEYIIRVTIKKQGFPNQHLNLIDCELEECMDFIKHVIVSQKLSPIISGNQTNVAVRESLGTNGKAMSFSFYGLDPMEVKMLIYKNIPE